MDAQNIQISSHLIFFTYFRKFVQKNKDIVGVISISTDHLVEASSHLFELFLLFHKINNYTTTELHYEGSVVFDP